MTPEELLSQIPEKYIPLTFLSSFVFFVVVLPKFISYLITPKVYSAEELRSAGMVQEFPAQIVSVSKLPMLGYRAEVEYEDPRSLQPKRQTLSVDEYFFHQFEQRVFTRYLLVVGHRNQKALIEDFTDEDSQNKKGPSLGP